MVLKNAIGHTANELREVRFQAKCPDSYCCYSRQKEGVSTDDELGKHSV